MGNKNLIITIEREYGSGGRIAGKKLAEELGLHFYDDEILKLTSEKSAVGEQFFRLADEKAGNNLLYKLGAGRKLDLSEKPSSTAKLTTPENLFKFQSSVIRELANEESCVIVGRAAGFVLDQDEEMERLIRIFVYADKVKKVQRVMEVDCIDEERAKRRIKKIEQERKAYYKYFTGSEWHSMKNYDLPINTTKLTFDETAELIKMYIGLKGFDK
ncbi:MAG: cytidylate kinase-like family protein [Clostridium sp.]